MRRIWGTPGINDRGCQLCEGIVTGSAQQPARPHRAACTRFKFDCGERQKAKSLAAGEAL
jgi:hypothetical protein